MFEQTFVQSQGQPRNPWTVAVSLTLQCMAVALLLLIPLLHTEVLRIPDPPPPHVIRAWIGQPPVPARPTSVHATSTSALIVPRSVFLYPTVHNTTPRQIDIPTGSPEAAAWSGSATAPFGFSIGDTATVLPKAVVEPPSTPTAVKPVVSSPLKVSGGVEAARLLFGPHPAYPPLAKATHSQGVVKMEAIIAIDGSIRNLRVVSGPSLLVEAALNAVRQWRYQPTLLNGIAVEVVTEIDVNFTLSQ